MNTWITLVRREFWENRSLWMAPLAAAGFVVLGNVLVALHVVGVEFAPEDAFPGLRTDFGGSDRALAISILAFSALILVLGLLAVIAYLMDSLYSERRDRSILFWKSLPVSDLQTVGSKVLVALVVVPAMLLGMVIATHLVCYLLAQFSPSPLLAWMRAWSPLGLLRSYSWMAALIAVNALWYAPVAGYLLLASVMARKSPWLTAMVPVVLVCVGEQLLLSTSHAWGWVFHRALPRVRVGGVLASPELWLGLLFGIGAFLAAVRARRWRDDS